jgi:ketosteroid isomerase-like protein
MSLQCHARGCGFAEGGLWGDGSSLSQRKESMARVPGVSRQPAFGAGRRPIGTMARWPVELDEAMASPRRDPWVGLVRSWFADYQAGRAERAALRWADDIVWRVSGNGPLAGEHMGPEGVFAYHRRLQELSDGTFRLRLLELEASGGPIVAAHLKMSALREGRRLTMPCMLIVELADGAIRAVTEMPGDQAAWDEFWAR